MSDPSRPPPSWYAWYVAGMLTLANVSGYIDRQILVALVGPIEREFGISDVQMSYLIGLGFAIFYTLLGLPIARWADRSNRRNIMAGGVALWSVFTTLCATATSFGRLLLCRIGVGVGEATINPASISLLSDYFPPERRSRAMSMYSLGVFLGSGVGYFIGGWVVQLVSVHAAWSVPVIGTIRPWQSAFLAVGLPGFAIALLLFTVREPPRAEVRAESARIPIRALAAYVSRHRRVFTMHSVGFAMSALVNFGIAAWLPTFFRRTYGWDEAAALRIQGLLTMTTLRPSSRAAGSQTGSCVAGASTGRFVSASSRRRGCSYSRRHIRSCRRRHSPSSGSRSSTSSLRYHGARRRRRCRRCIPRRFERRVPRSTFSCSASSLERLDQRRWRCLPTMCSDERAFAIRLPWSPLSDPVSPSYSLRADSTLIGESSMSATA